MKAVSKKYILFRVGDQDLAMPFEPSFKFISLSTYAPIPDSDPKILGLAYHDGNILTILDTAKILGLPAGQTRDKTCLLFAFKEDFYGLLVSEGQQIVSAKGIGKKHHILKLANILADLHIYD